MLRAPQDAKALAAALLAEGRAAWPKLRVPTRRFNRRALALIQTAQGAKLHGADLYLACACAEGAAGALAEFEKEHLSQVPSYVARIGRDPTFVQEVCSRLRERLLVAQGKRPPRIAEYSGRGALSSWLRIAAVR